MKSIGRCQAEDMPSPVEEHARMNLVDSGSYSPFCASISRRVLSATFCCLRSAARTQQQPAYGLTPPGDSDTVEWLRTTYSVDRPSLCFAVPSSHSF